MNSRQDPPQNARNLFGGIAGSYDRGASWLSIGQMPRWHRALVSVVSPSRQDIVLDVCTGTASVAIELNRRYSCRVVGLDMSPEMLSAGAGRLRGSQLSGGISLVQGRAEALPFARESFDSVMFTFLLRYVDDPAAVICEMARVLKPGGALASLEFGLPRQGALRAGWTAYAQCILPVVTLALGADWRRVGSFLGGNISEFCRTYPIGALEKMWTQAGIGEVRHAELTFGAAVVMWGRKH